MIPKQAGGPKCYVMKQKLKPLAVIAGILVLGVATGLVWQRSHRAASGERKPLFYQDSMHPWIKSDGPGKCTICAMDMTPIYEGEKGASINPNLVVLSSNGITVLNVQTDEVKPRPLSRKLRVAGNLEPNETSKTIISAPARGRIDALAVDYAGVEVEQGQKLITMFSPELVQLRKTLLAVRRNSQPGGSNAVSQVTPGSDIYTGDILAPQSGVVTERNVYNGQYVAEGDRMLTIVDSSMVWFRFDVYQKQLAWFELGQTIEVVVPGIPGKVFPAVVSFVEPTFNDATRTVKVRADIRNPVVAINGRKLRQLKFGMYAEGVVRAEVPNVLAVPRTAVLFRGGAAYAYVEKGEGAYERHRVKLGREGDELWEVMAGLDDGDRVITSGNVLIDAQSQFGQEEQPEEVGAMELDIPASDGEKGLGAEVHVPTITETRVSSLGISAAPQAGAAAPPAMPPGMGTNAPQRASFGAHASAGRTERMRAIMSPGSELQMVRRNTMLAERAAQGTNAPPPATAREGATPSADLPKVNPAADVASPAPPQQAADGMDSKPMAASPPANASNENGLQAFLAAAGGVSQALAGDNVESFNKQVSRVKPALAPLEKEFAAPHPWSGLVKAISESCTFEPASDLKDARKQFLPFSTAAVALAKQAKKDDPACRSIKIYHCPMAPKPGLWIQAKGPLANPFYGSKMLRCGEEVTQ